MLCLYSAYLSVWHCSATLTDIFSLRKPFKTRKLKNSNHEKTKTIRILGQKIFLTETCASKQTTFQATEPSRLIHSHLKFLRVLTDHWSTKLRLKQLRSKDEIIFSYTHNNLYTVIISRDDTAMSMTFNINPVT